MFETLLFAVLPVPPPVIYARPNKAGLFNTCSTWWVRVQSVWKRSNAENPAWCMCARFFCFPFVYGRHEIFLERNSTAVKSHTHAHKREAHVHTTKDEKCSCSCCEIALAFSERAHSLSEGRSQGVNHVLFAVTFDSILMLPNLL